MSNKTDAATEISLTTTEKVALADSPFDLIYRPTEKTPAIVVENFPALGKLVAMRFIEWAQANPEGVVSLPTGKTPEHFIKWVGRLLSEWDLPETRSHLEAAGVAAAIKPNLRGMRFVQIDEFYPIHPRQQNSFNYYVKEFYLEGFGFDPERAMLIDGMKIGLNKDETLEQMWPGNKVDLSLRHRKAHTRVETRQKDVLERVDQWCMEYEQQVQSLGGLGFFLGGIGPDGHIGFNIMGSDHESTTRLCPINYETQAAAAGDLGGIETARDCHVITVGLRTITHNPDCVAIIMAAGEAKAQVVANAIESGPDVRVPATCLQELSNGRFYLTRGAASRLVERRKVLLEAAETTDDATVDRILMDVCVDQGKRLELLTEEDCGADRFAPIVLRKRDESLTQLTAAAHRRLEEKISVGVDSPRNTRFLHTEPHHDDVMLGYFSRFVRAIRPADNVHKFVTLTSGFTSVTNLFMRDRLADLIDYLRDPSFRRLADEDYFDPDDHMARNRDMWQYLDGVAENDPVKCARGYSRRLLRNLFEVYEENRLEGVEDRLKELLDYLDTQYPGKRDPEHIQRLKGMCREWEAECLWGYYGCHCDDIHHLRLGFYTGDIFTEEPTMERDVPPIVTLLNETKPDVVTVAFDPEASGPDTHYKVLQAIAEALRIHEQETGRSDIRIWGYRNVWYRFDASEADAICPVSLNMFAIQQGAFLNAFLSQKAASFPSHEHDGPFCDLAQRIQVEQYQRVKTCLGREWFYENDSPLIRATRGLVFMKEMSLEEFYATCRELRRSVENR